MKTPPLLLCGNLILALQLLSAEGWALTEETYADWVQRHGLKPKVANPTDNPAQDGLEWPATIGGNSQHQPA
jgi:hypothetical protein